MRGYRQLWRQNGPVSCFLSKRIKPRLYGTLEKRQLQIFLLKARSWLLVLLSDYSQVWWWNMALEEIAHLLQNCNSFTLDLAFRIDFLKKVRSFYFFLLFRLVWPVLDNCNCQNFSTKKLIHSCETTQVSNSHSTYM